MTSRTFLQGTPAHGDMGMSGTVGTEAHTMQKGGHHMLMTWRIKNEGGRAMVSTALGLFTGYVLVWKGSDQTTSPHQQYQAQQITPQMRQEVIEALHGVIDLERHLWIATTAERTNGLVTLVHAVLDPETGARVDMLLSAYERNSRKATAYDSFGEFAVLTLELEHLGVTRLEVPLQLDADRAGLTYYGWTERAPGVFVWEKPRN